MDTTSAVEWVFFERKVLVMRFGVHLSMSGKLVNAPARGEEIGCRALQIFCGNPRGWQKTPLDPDQVKEFRARVAQTKIDTVVVHATYLINLASPEKEVYQKSAKAFVEEPDRHTHMERDTHAY